MKHQSIISEKNKKTITNLFSADSALRVVKVAYSSVLCKINTVELQWLEHHWDHGHLFETWVVRATEG